MDGLFPSLEESSPARDGATEERFRARRASVEDLRDRRAAWERLAAESLEANVFLSPAFALPLLAHMPADRQTELWIVDRIAPGREPMLVGLLPLGPRRLGRSNLAYTWQSLNACLGLPLLHRDHAEAALLALFDALAADRRELAGLVVQTAPLDGATVRLLRSIVERHDLALLERDGFTRPVFRPHTPAGRATLSPKSHLDTPRLRTSRRRLERRGELTHTIARDRATLVAAAKEFFALEASGWKGRRGTAVAFEDPSGGFTSAFIESLDPEIHRIHALRLDGRAIAMAVLLRDRDGTEHFWKIAYDEDVSDASPGRQLLATVTRAQARADVALTDSCAAPNDALVGPRWQERRAFCQLAIALAPARNGALAATFRRVDLARRWRERLRGILKLRAFRAADAG